MCYEQHSDRLFLHSPNNSISPEAWHGIRHFLYSFMHSTKCSLFSWAVNCYELHIFSLSAAAHLWEGAHTKNLKSSLRPKQFSSGSKKQRFPNTLSTIIMFNSLSFLNRLKCAKHLDVIATQRGHVKHNNDAKIEDLTIVSCLSNLSGFLKCKHYILEWCYAFWQKIKQTQAHHIYE